VVDPVAATIVGGARHADECLLESLDGADTLMVFGSGGGEVDTSGSKNGSTQATGEVGALVGGDATWHSVAAHDVFHEDVENLRRGRVAVEGNGLNPSGKRVNEHEKFRGSFSGVSIIVVRFRHGQDVGVKHIERVLADGRTNGTARAGRRFGGEGAFVAFGDVAVDLPRHVGPIETGTDKGSGAGGGGVATAVVESGDDGWYEGCGDERDGEFGR
jgi:hypothetical protein